MEDIVRLNKIKEMLGIASTDLERDKILSFVLCTAEDIIRNYCHLQEIPLGLETTLLCMALDLFKGSGFGTDEIGMLTKSISEGDTSVSFAYMADTIKDSILKDYRGQLNRFRRMVWK